jgi:hypothetical protein
LNAAGKDHRVPGIAGEMGNGECGIAAAMLGGLVLMIRKQKGREDEAT